MEISDFQSLIKDIYYQKDRNRGVEGTFNWFIEEVGELARSIRTDNPPHKQEEFGDVMAWLVSLGNLCGVDVEEGVKKYLSGCPKCGNNPCDCD